MSHPQGVPLQEVAGLMKVLYEVQLTGDASAVSVTSRLTQRDAEMVAWTF